jgi:hypothetical protein
LLFESGWENTTAVGCNELALLDTVWDDYGGSTACAGAVHDADVVDEMAFDGARSLRVTQKPCPTGPGTCAADFNGTDFRIVKVFGNQSEVTLLVRVRYDANYRWASADHKIAIFTDEAQTAQNVYLNTRGQPDGQHARVKLASIPAGDATFSDATPAHLVTTGVWYTIRVHVVAGDSGSLEAWLTPQGQPEMKLDLVHEAGPDANINDLPVGSIGGIKPDTTYNAGNAILENMYQWYDGIKVFSGLYMGQ